MVSQFELKTSLLLLAGLFVFGTAAAAEIDPAAPAIDFGGFSLYPGLGLAEKSDSNILRLNDADPNKKSSRITILSPSVDMRAKQSGNEYSLDYGADIGRYSNSSIDNYIDQRLLGLVNLGLSTRSTLNIQPEYKIGHDDRGTTYGGFTAMTEPNTWRSSGLKGSFAYGAEEARGQAVFDLGYNNRQYQNNRTVTTAYDRKLTKIGGTFYLRVQPKTQLLVNAKHTGISYADSASLLSGNELSLMVGVKWEASAQTSGEVRAGQLRKSFDTTYPTYTGGSWEGNVRWTPVTYINVDALTSRQPVETTLTGSSAIMVSNSGANVGYDLNEQLTMNVNGYQMKEDFVGAGRNDTTKIFGLKAEYKFRSWLVGAAELTNSKKTSSDPLNDYKRNIFMLSLRTVLN